MKSISNPNIQTAFEYLADTVIASMSHKQLWVCLNTTCIEHGRGTNWSPDPASDRDIAFFCECNNRRVFCKYNNEEDVPIEELRDGVMKLLQKELFQYKSVYKRLYGVDVTLRHEHISTIWNKVFCMSDTDFTLDLIEQRKDNEKLEYEEDQDTCKEVTEPADV